MLFVGAPWLKSAIRKKYFEMYTLLRGVTANPTGGTKLSEPQSRVKIFIFCNGTYEPR